MKKYVKNKYKYIRNMLNLNYIRTLKSNN